MTLNEAIQWALPQLRAEALARMTSTARVRRATGRTVQDETTGREVPEWADVYSGRFRLGGPKGGMIGPSKRVTLGGVEYQAAVRTGHFPVGTQLVDGDLIEVTAGENAGLVFRVIESDSQDQATALRVYVEAVQRPEEWA